MSSTPVSDIGPHGIWVTERIRRKVSSVGPVDSAQYQWICLLPPGNQVFYVVNRGQRKQQEVVVEA